MLPGQRGLPCPPRAAPWPAGLASGHTNRKCTRQGAHLWREATQDDKVEVTQLVCALFIGHGWHQAPGRGPVHLQLAKLLGRQIY